MPARHRCLCQSRPVIWLNGLFLQLKRGGLIGQRLFTALKRAAAGLVFAVWAALKWIVAFPPKAVHWMWTSLFWPSEESAELPAQPPRRKIANLHKLIEGRFAGPSWWDRIPGGAAMSWRAVCRSMRIGRLVFRRAILRARMAFQKHTAWTLATVTGSLGILLMIVMQLMYSFQTLKAKESPPASPQYHTTAKTLIDPGFPQLRAVGPPESEDLAQIDPFAPAQSDPSAMPEDLPRTPPETPATPEPLDDFPPLQPVPAAPDRQIPREPEPFVDPLDNLPPYHPDQYPPEPERTPEPAGNPFSPIPSLPTEPQPPSPRATEPPPSDNSRFEPPSQERQIPVEPIPRETEPFVDPLDNLPLSPSPPRDNLPSSDSNPPSIQPEPPPEFDPNAPPLPPVENPPKAEPNRFVDPLDNLPPRMPQSQEQSPEPPPEFDPNAPPLPPVENPPKAEPNRFVDPLDNLPPRMPQSQEQTPEPIDNPPEREPNAPMGQAAPPVDLGIGFQRLPAERDARFLLESDSEYRRNTLSREIGFDAWERSLEQKRQGPVSPRPYWERLSLDERRRLEQDLLSAPAQSDYEPHHQGPRGELNVEIAKTVPNRSIAHEPLKYEIVVENRGREMIEHVDVDEAVPPTHLLTDVSPAGHFENNLLRWRLRDIRPGERRRLAVEVIPSRTGTIETTTSVRPSARVATVTDVTSPLIRLRRSGYRTIALDESVLFTNHVENLSNTTQREVSIIEKVPEGYRVLQVEDGGIYDRRDQTITWNVASLPAGKTAKLNVRLQAESTGELVSRVKGSTREGKAVPILARVYVDRRSTGRLPSPVPRSANRRVPSRACSLCGCRCRCTVLCR